MSHSPYILGDTTRHRRITCVQVWSKSDQRRLTITLHKQADKQTDTTKIMVTWPWTNSNTSCMCPDNMINFDPLTVQIGLGHPCKFQWVSHLGSVTARHSSSGHQPNFVALNRGCHLYSAGRPSRWALAHILVGFLYMGCTLAPPGECDWTIRVQRRCGPMSIYFDHLLLLKTRMTAIYTSMHICHVLIAWYITSIVALRWVHSLAVIIKRLMCCL